MLWREKRLDDRTVFTGWDPYATPPGGSVVLWIVTLGTATTFFLFQIRQVGLELAMLPLVFGFCSWVAKRYRLEVSAGGFSLSRSWWGFVWFRRAFPPQSFVTFADDPWEPGWVDEGFALMIHSFDFSDSVVFGRGRRCAELSDRIRQVAEERGCWKCPVNTE